MYYNYYFKILNKLKNIITINFNFEFPFLFPIFYNWLVEVSSTCCIHLSFIKCDQHS